MKAYLTIEVDMADLADAVKAHKFKGVTREWEDRVGWMYEAHFEMPSRFGGYVISDYSLDTEQNVADYLIAESLEGEAA